MRRLVYTVAYDDLAFYVHESHRLNALNFALRKFATVGETMRKMQKLWDYGKPIGTNEDGPRRVAFLACLPSILSTTTLAKQGEVSVKDIVVAFQDWLPHVQQKRVEDFEAMLALCIDYDTGRTQYSAADELRWQEYHRKLASAPNTKKPARKDMAISWLRPLKGLAPVDYRQLCIKASTPRGRGRQWLFFAGYTRGRGKTKASLQKPASRLKERYAVRNALRYLSIKTNARQYSWRKFLQYPLNETMAKSNHRAILCSTLLRRLYKEVVNASRQRSYGDEVVGDIDSSCNQQAL